MKNNFCKNIMKSRFNRKDSLWSILITSQDLVKLSIRSKKEDLRAKSSSRLVAKLMVKLA